MVLAHQQIENIDIIVLRDRPVHKEPRPCPLAQGIVDVFRVVGKHPKGAIAAHNGVGARKALHQYGSDLQLTLRRALAIAALARQLVNIVNRAKPDHIWIDHVVDERLGVLAGLALIAVDIVGA